MKNTKSIVSIITISFNSAKTIEKTILSVINQTYENIEYIIIDGGSTDGTIDIIKKYQDKITYWISEPDRGISDAFNKGILASHGNIIGIINSDDWYEIDAIESVIKLDEQHNADFYIGAVRYYNKYNNNFIFYPDKNYRRKIKYYMPHMNHPATFFKKEVYNKVGLYDVKYKYAMDYDLFLRVVLNKNNGYLTNQIFSNMLSGGISDSQDKETFKEVLSISKNKKMGAIRYFLSLFNRKIKKIIIFIGGQKLLFLLRNIVSEKMK